MSFFEHFIVILLLSVIFNHSSAYNDLHLMQNANNKMLRVERLSNETYYFPAKKLGDLNSPYQSLQRFDFIFVGYDLSTTASIEGIKELTLAIPGFYTHLLVYLGKDSQGFAYGAEMRPNEKKNFRIGLNGIKIDGRFHIYCLGNDFGTKQCPKDTDRNGLDIYDYMWAKRPKTELREQLVAHENELMAIMKEDFLAGYPFQIPISVGVETPLIKAVVIVDDGRQNGADCTSYFVSLFEEVAKVCFDEIHINAETLLSYYSKDSIGKQAVLPAQYNPLFKEETHVRTLIEEFGYYFVDNSPRQTSCPDHRMVTGTPTPDLVFNSPSMVDITPFYR